MVRIRTDPYATATPVSPLSTRDRIYVVATLVPAVARKMTADTVVMARMKLYAVAETMVDRSRGKRTDRRVLKLPARCRTDASSRLVEIWLSADIPPRMPTGMARIAMVMIRMIAVPVSSTGGILTARM